jgi:hypothetical protein
MDSDVHESVNEDLEKKYDYRRILLFYTKIYFNRRLRNRLAQRAFRRRQTNRLKELRDRVDLNDKPYDETVKTLQDENSLLRRNLVEVQSNLARLIATMQKLSGTVSGALCESPQNEPSSGQTDCQACVASTSRSSSSEEPDLRVKGYGLADIHDTSFNEAQIVAFHDYTQLNDPTTGVLLSTQKYAKDGSSTSMKQAPDHNSAETSSGFCCPAQQMPSIWGFEYQMGVEPYADALARREHSSIMRGRRWIETNSPFSDHIQVLQRLLKSKIAPRMPLVGATMNLYVGS